MTTNDNETSPLFIVYGPPGVGKTTSVLSADRVLQIRTLDLETLPGRSLAEVQAAVSAVRPVVVGAADVSVTTLRVLYPHAQHVLMLPPRREYIRRRLRRQRTPRDGTVRADAYHVFRRNTRLFDVVVDGAVTLLAVVIKALAKYVGG